MFLKKVDFLSPQITLYHKGFSSHSSIVSGIISIIAFLIIILFGIYYSLDLIKRQCPKAFYFNRFVEDAGIFPLNASSLFHYVSITNFQTVKDFDLYSFRLVGFEMHYLDYIRDRNISKFNHWLYGKCNYDIDAEGIQYLLNKEDFERSVCIKKFYNSEDGKYYETNNPNFRWPRLEHGNSHSDMKSYSIVMERCKEETLELLLGEGNKCKGDENMEYLFHGDWGTHFNIIDNCFDVLDFKEPNKKYLYRIENTLDKDNYSINHMNFNPSSILTNKGIIFDDIYSESSYIFERNDAFAEKNDPNKEAVYMIYNFWMKNRLHYYERVYKTIQDVISDIGGISEFITMLASIINSFYNNYIIILDFENLISPSIYEHKDNKNLKKNFELSSMNNNSENELTSVNNPHIEKKVNSMTDKQEHLKENSNINNKTYIKEKRYTEDSKIVNSDNNGNKKIDIIEKKNFWNFLIKKITCEKKNYYLIYDKLRTYIMSEENILKNHLDVYSLLKMSDKQQFELDKKFQLKELLNEK